MAGEVGAADAPVMTAATDDKRLPQVDVLGLPLADVSRAELVEQLVRLTRAPGRPMTAFAVHVGGLSAADRPTFLRAMRKADVVYADGVSAVALARVAGALRIERSPTTDIGWSVLRGYRQATGRPARVAAIGGSGDTSAHAMRVLEHHGLAETTTVTHGFHTNWKSVLDEVCGQSPDIVLVGLGAPREMLWVCEHLASLPPALVLTCGGWFKFIVGEESRAPRALRRFGLEWLYRLCMQPRRLSGRYARGLFTLPLLACQVAVHRCSPKRRTGQFTD